MSPYARGFRPTRRDMLVACLTLGVAWLVFMTSHSSLQSAQVGEAARSRISSLGDLLTNTKPDAQQCQKYSAPTFNDEHVKVGFEKRPDEMSEAELKKHTTQLVDHQAGYTFFENLYLHHGQLFVVTDKRSDFPDLPLMTSTGLSPDVAGEEERLPKGDEILFISSEEAQRKWGEEVYRLRGMTWFFNDGAFYNHYYHWAAEAILGQWRAHAIQDPNIDAYGRTTIEPPQRAWFLHQEPEQWRDNTNFNAFVMWAWFPNIGYLYPKDMQDTLLITDSKSNPKAFKLDKAILSDRSAAFRKELTGHTQRTAASAYAMGKVSRWWWEPMRRQILRFSGVSEEVLDRNLEGYGAVDPEIWESETPPEDDPDYKPLRSVGSYTPVVTYISRQGTKRRALTPEAHNALVKALEEGAEKLGYDLIVLAAEKHTKEEQFAIAAKTTIMLGVHGNGLSHLLWMPSTPRSAVIEMFCHGGFAHDYQWTAHALGLRHFAIQHDKVFTMPNKPKVNYPDCFQTNQITVDARVVADVIEARLKGEKYPYLE